MNRKTLLVVATLWIVSLVGVGLWAQSPKTIEPIRGKVVQSGQAVGDVITGAEIGFQRVGAPNTPKGKVFGKWMVKVNGEWLETQSPIGIVRGGSN